MKFSSPDRGLVVSGAAHVVLLVAILVAFSDTKQFEDAQESIPIEMVTTQQLAQIMKGEKTEKEIKPQPTRVDKVADITETHKAPVAEAKTDVPTPPPRLRHIPDPGEDDQPPQPPQPQRQAALPPPPPRPADLPKAELKPLPPPKPDAEAIAPPPPPQRPKDEPKKVAAVTPPLPPTRPIQKPPPKPDDKFKLDEVAKIISADKSDKPSSKPKSGDETADPTPRFNPSDISRLLSKDAPQQKASTGRTLSQVASLGSPTASAAKMSPSLWGQLDAMLVEQYKKCWTYLGLGNGTYIPQIEVEYTSGGALATVPKLRNPPSDPSMRSLAQSALRAVQECNPLKIPAQYAPYYDEWKSRTVGFNPEDMAE